MRGLKSFKLKLYQKSLKPLKQKVYKHSSKFYIKTLKEYNDEDESTLIGDGNATGYSNHEWKWNRKRSCQRKPIYTRQLLR